MKIAIIQPYLFSYIGYFQLINSVDKFVILDDVNFIMKGWINRNRILVNGKDHMFSVPVRRATQNKKIFECELANPDWKFGFLKTLEYCYKKAPYFNSSLKVIESALSSTESNLSTWLFLNIRTICTYLDINTEIVETSRIYKNQNLKAQEKILDICKQEEASVYINPLGGKDLYNTDAFNKIKCGLKFLKPYAGNYKQFRNEFIPFLSIIDVMMFNDKNQIRELLNKIELYD